MAIYLMYWTQDLIRKAVKKAPVNAAAKLIKKEIDPKLKKSAGGPPRPVGAGRLDVALV